MKTQHHDQYPIFHFLARIIAALAVLAASGWVCLPFVVNGPEAVGVSLVQAVSLPLSRPLTGTVPHPLPRPADLPAATEVQPVPLASSRPSAHEAGMDTAATPWHGLIERLAADGFDKTRLETAFANLGTPPLPGFMGRKAVELYARYGTAQLLVPENAATDFTPPDYSRAAGGVTAAAGRRVIRNNERLFESLHKRYGVPAPFIVAVLMVETGIGAELGKQPALLALGSMASMPSLGDVLPVIKGIPQDHAVLDEQIRVKSEWAYEELKALITYADALGRDVWTMPGSVFGAVGICQFMPSNINMLGVSSSNKRPVPDVFSFTDAAASVARYLAAHGWKNAQTPEAQTAVLRAYNHSDIYASTVYGVANALMAPTTHAAAQSARQGKNAVAAARESARTALPANPKGRGKPLDALAGYSELLQ